MSRRWARAHLSFRGGLSWWTPRRWSDRSSRARAVELVDVAFEGTGGRRTLRVTVDRDGGLDLDAIATLSDKIARRLDLEDFGEGRYELEVSTPGIERSLRTPAQFARALGQQVKVKTTEPLEGVRVHTGALVDSDDDGHRAGGRRRTTEGADRGHRVRAHRRRLER